MLGMICSQYSFSGIRKKLLTYIKTHESRDIGLHSDRRRMDRSVKINGIHRYRHGYRSKSIEI